MNLIDQIRSYPGLAPKASKFNQVAKNLDDLFAATTFRGALIQKTADQSFTSIQLGGDVTFASTVYDTSSIWSGGNPSRLTVPSGVTRVRLHCNLSFDINFSGNACTLEYFLNGTHFSTGLSLIVDDGGGSGPADKMKAIHVTSPVISCASSDYFSVNIQFNTVPSAWKILSSDGTWFAMEIVK